MGGLDPLVLEQAPVSRVGEWLYFQRERGLYLEWKAQEATFRAEQAAWRASQRTH